MKTASKPITIRRIRSLLKKRFGGVLKYGKHPEDGECCVLELASVLRGVKWTDEPMVVRCFDLRPLNDMNVSDELRSKWMTRLLVAYDGSLDWLEARRKEVAAKIVIGVVQQIIAELPSLPDAVREQCRKASTLDECQAAADAANAADAGEAAAAAHAGEAAAAAAARAAAEAAAAARAAQESIFTIACKIWLKACDGSS